MDYQADESHRLEHVAATLCEMGGVKLTRATISASDDDALAMVQLDDGRGYEAPGRWRGAWCSAVDSVIDQLRVGLGLPYALEETDFDPLPLYRP
jgi:hypothetical protein